MTTATLGGGCFWCFEAIFMQLDGVTQVRSGYSGGSEETANYEAVCSGASNHAEVVQITFQPETIKFEDLLQVFFSLHDPTTLDQQGADIGSQYRSVIFYHNQEQKIQSEKVIEQFQKKLSKGKSKEVIVTKLSKFETFFKAEQFHQRYWLNQPNSSYCQLVINPKLNKLSQYFPDLDQRLKDSGK